MSTLQTAAPDAYVRACARSVLCHRRRNDGGPCIGYANTALGLRGQRRVAVGDRRFLLLASLVIVALHQYWRGAAAITVSVVGWVFALRAVFLMAFPHAFMAAADAAIGMSGLMGERRRIHRTRRAVSNLCRLGSCTEPASGTSGNINCGAPTRSMMCAHGSASKRALIGVLPG